MSTNQQVSQCLVAQEQLLPKLRRALRTKVGWLGDKGGAAWGREGASSTSLDLYHHHHHYHNHYTFHLRPTTA
ncbi:hypothetical protein Pmani_000298 [Petrolisthes manimaculis]|uniref:Uncharacterized protein n=1 Tax=Petrolisthes manimaculis TaxID=1843537 RepID=A0AAE1QLZ1_9EUCA|nr:hypothetical protein Pmani_000298 [Petrolisthes manimaculis]